MNNTQALKWMGGIVASVVIGSLAFGPPYKARDGALKIEATSEIAAQKRRDTIAQAEADRDAAIIRAHAVADANRIMSNSLRTNARYFMRLQKKAEEDARQ